MLSKFKKSLRLSQTDAESRLWFYLKNNHLRGFKFRRQHILQGYIVDFVCLKRKLVVELDGSQHAEREEYDQVRTQILEKEGFRVVRFWNSDVLGDVDVVLEVIYNLLME